MTDIDPEKLMMLREQMVEARKKADALFEQSQDAGCEAAHAYDRFVSYAQHGDSPPQNTGAMLGVAGDCLGPRNYSKAKNTNTSGW